MSELPSPTNPVAAPPDRGVSPAVAAIAAPAPAAGAVPASGFSRRWLPATLLSLAVLAAIGVGVAWRAQQRVKAVEQELVARQRASHEQSAEARLLAQQAQEAARESAAKLAVLESRIGELAVQRSHLDELIGTVARPREETLVGDIDTALRMAMQQSAVSGSAEPLILALRQADDRLARHRHPRLESLRRAIARDLERMRGGGAADMATLTGKIDEAVRMVDELPLQAAGNVGRQTVESEAAARGAETRKANDAQAPAASAWWPTWIDSGPWRAAVQRVWGELRSLVRVTRIDHPEAMLLAPEQAFFLRENLKLRLLNARLALLSRQFDSARSDLLTAERWLQRYFDDSSRRTRLAAELLRQVAAQAHPTSVPRPDDTLAALAAAR